MTTYLCDEAFLKALQSESDYLLEFNSISDTRAKELLLLKPRSGSGSLNAIEDTKTCEILSSRLNLDIQPVQRNDIQINLYEDHIVLAKVIEPTDERISSVGIQHQYTIHFWFIRNVILN